jgi:hypothetical protein
MGEKAEAMDLAMSILGNRGSIHPAVLWDDEGATLIDAGLPGQLELFREKLEALGLKLKDVRRILLTHQDIDHIGSASDVAQATGAEVYAHVADVPFIQGEKPLLKFDSGRIEQAIMALPEEARREAQVLFSSPPKVQVDHALDGGEPRHATCNSVAEDTAGVPDRIRAVLSRRFCRGQRGDAAQGAHRHQGVRRRPARPYQPASIRNPHEPPMSGRWNGHAQ